ncbi:MAG: HAMP domain-containing histidine kinase [Alphaproteobacteria bacterium]|nr:HAMP domain-containing histidine kinase [Alphaproteobacteria bacterium]
MATLPTPFRSFSLRHLARIGAVVLILGAAGISYKLYEIRQTARSAVEVWREVTDIGSPKEKLFRRLIMQMGLEGLIHPFKAYVLTGDETIIPSIYAAVGATRSTIGVYRQQVLTPDESEGLDKITATVERYNDNVAVALRMRKNGARAKEIDKAVRVDDGPAVAGFTALVKGLLDDLGLKAPPQSKALKPQFRLLGNLRMSLGYNGLVHNYDNYILRHDETAYQRFQKSLAYARLQIDEFRRSNLTAVEAGAIDDIEHVVDQFEAGLSDGRLEQLYRSGASPEEIYAALNVDPTPLGNGLRIIETDLRRQEEAVRNALTRTLWQASRIADQLLIVVVLSLVVFLTFGIWFVSRFVVGRVNAVTKTMLELSSGNLDARISYVNDHDEIGEMSRALLVFRDNMRANITLNRELADNARMASLGALVAGIAHEINTPIGNALTVSTTLSEHVANLKEEVATGQIRRSLIDEHIASSDTAARLLEKNLTRACELIGSFKQLAVDQTSDQRRGFQLTEVLKNVSDSVRPLLRKAGHRLSLTADAALQMESYPGALSQVLMNLVDNCKLHGFAGSSGGSIAITARKVEGGCTEITVEDDGCGIQPDVLPRIFEAFFTTRAGSGGSGLGLHIVRTLVTGTLGGEIRVEARPSGGTRFVLTVPLVAPKTSPETTTREEKVYYVAA